MRRVTINIGDGVSDLDVIDFVRRAIAGGRISTVRGRKAYCLCSVRQQFSSTHDFVCLADVTRTGNDTFHVYLEPKKAAGRDQV